MLNQYKKITLKQQGLIKSNSFGKGERAVINALEHLGYIQIDTLSVVERAHHHTIWTRIPDYKNEQLNTIVKKGKAFEYWFHAAAYLPMKDYRFSLPKKMHFKRGESKYYNNVDSKTLSYVLDKIKSEGPLKARDFKSNHQKSGSWWDWKPSKVALEKLFMQGDLMISEREGMQKVYDLTERVLPANVITQEPTKIEMAEHLVENHLNAFGISSVKQMTHLRSDKVLKNEVELVLKNKLESKELSLLDIDGNSMVVHSDLLNNSIKYKPELHILSPFDNALIHRDRLLQLFNFDYKIECYTPKEKRQFGYFCLPILYGNQFLGRMDCKVYRKLGVLEIIHLHIEASNLEFDNWISDFVEKVKSFAVFNGCDSIEIKKVSPNGFDKKIKSYF